MQVITSPTMILRKLKVLSRSVWQVPVATARYDPGTNKPQPSYILQLPPEILEEIIRVHLALAPGNYYLNAIKTLSLVHRSWLPSTRYLAYVKHLKTHLPPPPAHSGDFVPTGQSRRASCRTLFIGIIKSETLDTYTIGFQLFQLVGHSLRTLELRGLAGAFWGPKDALLTTSKHAPFLPRLRQLRVLDVGTWTIMAYLCAIWKGDGKAGPSGLVVHHDFEISRERDLLSAPVDVLAGIVVPSNGDQMLWSLNSGDQELVTREFLGMANNSPASKEFPIRGEDDRRPPLDLYISRRSHVGEFILRLPQAKLLMNVLKRSVQTVDVWLKDGEEIGSEMAFAIGIWELEHFIERNAVDGETTHSLLHEF
ncbi:hypothetical protein FS837_005214 [Tulasnella sp. UAMH 9824]|nr:hypothetical protein FS837_005214 [Tulasnella sp. UAMH 9824]